MITPNRPFPPGWVYGPHGWEPAPLPQSNGIATAGFVCSLIGLVLSPIPVLGWVLALILAAVGIPLAAVGWGQASRKRGVGRGLAIAGVVCGVAAVLIAVVFIAAVANAARPLIVAALVVGVLGGLTTFVVVSYVALMFDLARNTRRARAARLGVRP